MEGRAETSLRAPAHPMPGWMAVMPIPNVEKQPEAEPEVDFAQVGPFRMFTAALGGGETGITAAVVVELCPIPDEVEERFAETIGEGFKPGCKVYYTSDRGIPIGDYEYLSIKSVICWEPEGA